MITSKKLPIIVAILLLVCFVFSWYMLYKSNTAKETKILEYEKKMFSETIVSLEISVDEDEWQEVLDNATSKEWISADISINGELFRTVGIRTKGNSSLSGGIRTSGESSNDYSLNIKMNKYVKGQTYYGLDTFCVNNMMGDTTYMKDFLAYDIMRYIGVDAPLANYANVSVNGNAYGFGVLLERYDKAFLTRVYGNTGGQLYNVKIGMGQRGNFEERWENIENDIPNREIRDAANPIMIKGVGIGGAEDISGGGGSLLYTDDSISSYSAIFDNAVFKSSDKDKQRVITAIKHLNEGTDLEKYIDVDASLRYFAAHTVLVNLDSYTSNMQQNFYLYEKDGKLTILPWDYGLSFGGFQSGNASSVVNFPIDTPVSGISMESRPLLNMLLAVDEYQDLYHKYLKEIEEGYIKSGLAEKAINETDKRINEYVKNDVSASYTYEQYEASLPQLIEILRLRAESIEGQLNGTIPSSSVEQSQNSDSLVDASSVNLAVLGSMMGGAGMRQDIRQDGQPEMFNRENQPDEPIQNIGGIVFGGEPIDMEAMQKAMTIIAENGGEITEEVKKSLLDIGISEEQINMFSEMRGGFVGGNMRQGGNPNGGRPVTIDNRANNPQDGFSQPQTDIGRGMNILILVVLLVLLVITTIFIAKPKKDNI